MQRSAIVVIIPLLLWIVTGQASAHAFLDHAEPRVGNTVATAPREVTLWFTQKLEPAFSSITVTNSAGQRVDTEFHPRVLNWGGTIQYSMPYLKSAVVDLGLPDFINRFIPLVEATMQTPVSNTFTSGTVTTGTINPGFIWVGNTFQIAVEALIPINRQSGTNVGVIAQLHLYLDDIDPRGIGRPIFGNAPPPATPFGRN